MQLPDISDLFQREGHHLFFILKGFLNGNADYAMHEDGPPNSPLMADGWYAMNDDEDTLGPYASIQEVERAVEGQWG